MKFFLRRITLACAIGSMTVISACGQKGKLLMPVKPPAISTPYPVAQPKPAESDQNTQPVQAGDDANH